MKKEISRDILYEEYITKEESIKEIAKFFNLSYNTAKLRLKENNIKIRKDSEQMRINYKRRLIKNRNYLPENVDEDPKFFYIIGAIKGDGHVNEKDGVIQISVIDMDFLKYFKSIINELMPNWNVKILKHIEGKENIKSQFRISIGSRDFSIKFRNFIPRTRDQKIWFLKGIFDAEGSAYFSWKMRTIGKYQFLSFNKNISLSQKDVKDLELWSSYLNELSIKSSLHDNSKKLRRNSNRIKVSDIAIKNNDSIRQFKNLVGFRIKRKHDRLNYIISNIGKSQMKDKDISLILKLYKETSFGSHSIAKILDRSKSSILYILKKYGVSYRNKPKGNHFIESEIRKAEEICNRKLDFLLKNKEGDYVGHNRTSEKRDV